MPTGPALQRAIAATGAERVIVTHGYEAVMVRWLDRAGPRGAAFATEYGDSDDDEPVASDAGVAATAAPVDDGVRRDDDMKRFARLFAELDAEHRDARQGRRAEALLRRSARRADAAWAVYFLAGGKPRQVGAERRPLGSSPAQRAGIDDWLFDACYQAVGDFAETVAHVLPPPTRDERSRTGRRGSSSGCLRCAASHPKSRRRVSPSYWDELDSAGRFLLNKLIGGSFRVGVSKLLVQRALAEGAGVDAKLVAQRMMGYTDEPRDAERRALRAPDRVGRASDRSTSASRIRSSSPTSSTSPESEFASQARRRPTTGSSSGSTTASAPR